MEFLKGIYSVPGEKCIFIKDLDLIAISDLQLGEELYLAKELQMYAPQKQLEKEIKQLESIKNKVKASRLLINGDLKHEFSELNRQESREINAFLKRAEELFKEIIIIRGNHDNFLVSLLKNKYALLEYYEESGFLFTHGHKMIDFNNSIHTIIIGHEEPVILLRKGFDHVKLPAIVYGKFKSTNLIILPAFSPISEGTPINVTNEYNSPFLNKEEILNFKAIGIDEELGELIFPEISKIYLS
ncbi:MAG: metallophosphoesterase [Candidatus Rehaiarchaeum fermentans]|nr:metallophosphoesterase [Candidatus Rehaiarchaeum fermentans]